MAWHIVSLWWKMFCVHLERMYILQVLGRVFHTCVSLSLLLALFKFSIFLLIFCVIVVLITDRRVLKSPTTIFCIVYLSFQFFQFLLYVLWGSLVKYINIYNYNLYYLLWLYIILIYIYIFLMYWLFYFIFFYALCLFLYITSHRAWQIADTQ